MKQSRYFFIWVEGFEPKGGEKVKCFNDNDIDYTLEMADAMRVKSKDIPKVIEMMRMRGVANWVLESQNTFVRTNYAPKGTIFNANKRTKSTHE